MATVEKEKFHGTTGKSEQALQKRNEQLKKWEKSETNRQPASIAPSRLKPRIRFGDNIVFLAAAASGDLEDVETLVKEKGADVNCHSKDGLTALHQACIDDNFEMVKLLVNLGSSVNAVDNEGWTALHAATSCCHEHIVEFLLAHGAFPAPVNNDGKSPLDLLDDVEEGEEGEENTKQTIRNMLQDAINVQGVDVDAAKSEEEHIMLVDAQKLKTNPSLSVPLSSGQATPLHVAAAKNYLDVLKILLGIKSNKIDVNAVDEDGWTPLHAAVYWGNMDAAALLVQGGANLNLATKLGETLNDLCESQEDLESLQKLSRDKKTQSLSRYRPPLPRTNSRDRFGESRPSPIVRRRSSKERIPKNKDMQDEREFMEHYSSEEGDEIFDSKTGSDAEFEEAGKSSFNHVPESPGSDSLISDNRSSDELTTPNSKGSPKAGAKKAGMSPQMMKRVNLFEKSTPTTSNLQPPTPVPLTSTPLSSPIITEDNGDNCTPKRFPFKPHTIPQDASIKPQNNDTRSNDSNSTISAVESRTPDVKLGSDSKTTDNKFVPFRKRTEAVLKRGSAEISNWTLQDVSNRASLEITNRDVTNRASFEGSGLSKDISLIQEPTIESKSSSKSQGGPEPTSKDATVTTQGTPTPQSVTLDHQRVSREQSADSSASDLSRNNSNSQDAEAQRKIRAKEKRERRKPTQTVSQEVYDQLFKSQGSEETEGKDENEVSQQDGYESFNDSSTAKVDDDSTKGSDDNVAKFGEDSSVKSGDDTAVKTVAPVVHQSAYRPSTRPSPRIKSSEPSPIAPFWSSITTNDTKASTPSQPPPSQPPPLQPSPPQPSPSEPSQSLSPQLSEQPSREERCDVLDVTNTLDDSVSPADRSRSKSAARRKHKEKRRVTGIPTEVGDNEDIPENVRDIIGKKAVEEVSVPSDQDSNINVESPSIAGDELLKLQKALENEKSKTNKLQQSLSAAQQDAEKFKERVAELQRRCEDTNRAYEQASGEAARKQTRIDELEKQLQDVQGLKNESQRLKDENSALIRVIGRLSRGPSHT